MATYETFLIVPCSVEQTFAFVSDFRNAAEWDPRTFSADKTTDGPIGVGTRFVLTGGMMTEDLVRRLHIPRRIASMPLPYDVVEFDAPHEFVLEGETRMVRYRDHLEFSPEGDGTRLRYFAELDLKGPMRVLGPMMKRIFDRIGDDATRDLPATVVRGT